VQASIVQDQISHRLQAVRILASTVRGMEQGGADRAAHDLPAGGVLKRTI